MTDSLDMVFDYKKLNEAQDRPLLNSCSDSLDEGSIIQQPLIERKKNLVIKKKVYLDQNGKILTYKPLSIQDDVKPSEND